MGRALAGAAGTAVGADLGAAGAAAAGVLIGATGGVFDSAEPFVAAGGAFSLMAGEAATLCAV